MLMNVQGITSAHLPSQHCRVCEEGNIEAIWQDWVASPPDIEAIGQVSYSTITMHVTSG
jgi:hypothetical protein